jgi:phage I-like protein
MKKTTTFTRKGEGIAVLSLVPVDGDPPEEFRIFKLGENSTTKGILVYDKESAASVMAFFKKHGAELFFDWNHNSLKPDASKEDCEACGWFVPEAREDGLYAASIRWTEDGAEALVKRRFRYFSPAVIYDLKTGRVLRLINAALTNLPATDNLIPLMAASETESEDMDPEIFSLFGLDPTKATPADLLNAAREAMKQYGELKAKMSGGAPPAEGGAGGGSGDPACLSEILVLTGKATAASAVLEVKALRERAVTLSVDLEATGKRASSAVAGMVSALCMLGKVTPAGKETAIALASKDPEGVFALLSAIPSPVEPGSLGEKPRGEAAKKKAEELLSPEELAGAKAMGLSAEAFLAEKDKRTGAV